MSAKKQRLKKLKKEKKEKNEAENFSLLTVFLSAILIGFFSFYTFPWSKNAFPAALLIGAFVGLFQGSLLGLSLASFLSSSLVFLLNANFPAFRPHYQLDMNLSYLVPSLNPNSWLFAGLLSLFATLLLRQFSATIKEKKGLLFILLVLILSNYLFTALSYNRALSLAATEPPDETYRFDPVMFLKTFYLMEKGLPYYKAYAEGYKRDTAHDGYPEYTQTFRFPTIFYLWKFLCPPSGSFINLLFTFFALTSLLASFFLVWKFSQTPLALVAPVLLAPYLLYGNLTLWFLATEYWALFSGLPFIIFYLYNLPLASLGLAFFSALVREFGIFYLLAGTLASWFKKKKKESFFWIGAVAIFFLTYLFHQKASHAFTAGQPAQSFFAWQAFRLNAFKAIAEYGFVLAPFNQVWAFPLLFLSLAGVALLKAEKQIKVFLLANLSIPLVTFLVFGRDPGAGYWGVVWMPIVLSTFPLFLLYLDKILKKVKRQIR